MNQKNFSIKKQLKSFKYAFNGLWVLLSEERNARIHLFVTVCVLAAGFVFEISKMEWVVVILCIGLVFALELVNTAIENMADFVSKEYHDMIKKIKDLTAAAVLIAAIAAAAIGLIIFFPKIIGLQEIFKAVLLGIVQGLTEFLPVSSSGHIVIGSELLGLSADENLSFAIVVHAATVMSTIVILWSEIWKLLQGVFKFQWNEQTKYAAKIVLSMIPILVVGLFFKEAVEKLFGSGLLLVGCCLLGTSALLIFASKAKPKEKKEIGWRDAFLVGLAQAVAVLPGLSRSGATISTGILLGNNKENIAKFSFLMVLIPILGEAVLDMKDFLVVGGNTTTLSPAVLLSGFISAFIAGCFACKWMISLVRKGKLIYFAIYCAVIGAIAVGYEIYR